MADSAAFEEIGKIGMMIGFEFRWVKGEKGVKESPRFLAWVVEAVH